MTAFMFALDIAIILSYTEVVGIRTGALKCPGTVKKILVWR